jgi:predicted glycosyltransferase
LVESFPRAEVLIITGSPCATLFPTPARVGLVKVPSVSKSPSGEYVPRSLAGTLADTLDLRRRLILDAYRSFRPSLVLVDHKVVGLQGEVFELLQRARADGVHTMLGIRDVIDSPGAVAIEWGGERCRWALVEGYERVCVYGSPEVFDPRIEYPIPPELGPRVEFTGYVVRPPVSSAPSASTRRPRVLVTMGGGQDGLHHLEAYLEGLTVRRPEWDSVLVGGPLLDERDARRLRHRADALGNVEVRRFHADLPWLLAECDAVVAMAGYNTCAEVLQSRRPAVLLPRTHPRMEQAIRAERLEKLGLATSLIDPRPSEILAAVERSLAAGPLDPTALPSLDGVRSVCSVVHELVAESSPARLPRSGAGTLSVP